MASWQEKEEFFLNHNNKLFFLQKDCPKGKLNKKKFIEVYKVFYPQGKAEKFCTHVFKTFDTGQLFFLLKLIKILK